MEPLTRDTEKFFNEWSPNYTIKRTLKGYNGHHRRVENTPAGGVWQQPCAELLKLCAQIIRDLHENQGYTLTLRQLYYQLVKSNFVPNHDVVYKVLSIVLTNARKSGIISWSAMEDRNRKRSKAYTELSVAGALRRARDYYRLDGQDGQPKTIIVMAEKDAVSGIIGPVCNRYHAPYMINRGYLSTSMMHAEYARMANAIQCAEKVVILYLGDHDPSGVQMREDVHRRLAEMLCSGRKVNLTDLFYEMDKRVAKNHLKYLTNHGSESVPSYSVKGLPEPGRKSKGLLFSDIQKAVAAAYICNTLLSIDDVALTWEQVQEMNLPPNPAKMSDSRAPAFVELYGTDSYELDAIAPADLENLVEAAIIRHMDMEIYEALREREAHDQEEIQSIISGLQ